MGLFSSEERTAEKEERIRRREELRETRYIENKHSKPVRILLGVLKYGFFGLAGAFFVFVMIRIFLMKAPGDFKEFSWTETALCEWREKKASVNIEKQPLFSYITDDGFFHGDYVYVLPEAGELQISVWYRDNIPEKAAKKIGNESLKTDPSPFRFSLVDEEGTVYTPETFLDASRAGYTYSRLIFDGIDFSRCQTLHLSVTAANTGDEKLISKMLVYHAEYIREPVSLTPDE